MLFNSYEFIFLFLPVVLIGFYLLDRYFQRYSRIWIIVSSLIFYSYWDYRFTPIIIISIVVNWKIGHLLYRYKSTYWLVAGILINLSAIGWFKYANFFYSIYINVHPPTKFFGNIILPLGISFFTFQQIAYLVNVWRGIEAPSDLKTHSFIVLFFPHLIAGPLVLYQNLAGQLRKSTKVSPIF